MEAQMAIIFATALLQNLVGYLFAFCQTLPCCMWVRKSRSFVITGWLFHGGLWVEL